MRRLLPIIACALAVVPFAAAAGPGLLTRHMLDRAAARQIIDAIAAEAGRTKQRIAIAVVDDRGALIAAERLDGTLYTAIDLATAKARSAAGGVDTATLAAAYKAGETELATLSGQIPLPGGVTLYAGGVPVQMRGDVVGAIGVSGADPATDHRLATLGAAIIARQAN